MNEGTKKDPKTFTLRDVNTCIVRTPDLLKKEIKRQFKEDITDSDFEVGYHHSNNLVTFRKSEDLVDIWNDIKKGQKHVLWCDGLKIRDLKRKKSNSNDSDNEDEKGSKKRKTVDDKEERVGQVIDQLKRKHGDNYTHFQFRILSEMFVSGIYTSLDDPP